MSDSTCTKAVQQLVDQGWIVIFDEDKNEIVSIRSVIQNWRSMTWAERIYYTAKYGFDENGILNIRILAPYKALGRLRYYLIPSLADTITVPEQSQPSSNDRLQAVLFESRIAVEDSRYDDAALAHIGPDGSAILTNEYLWGLPDPRDDSYTYLDERYTCLWEFSLATWCPDAPWWALNPDGKELD